MTHAPERNDTYYSRKHHFGRSGIPYKMKYNYATRLLADGETEIIEIPKEFYQSQAFVPELNSELENEKKIDSKKNPKEETFKETDYAHLPKHFKLRILGIRESQIREDSLKES